jgi:hypothetical protein
MALGLCSCFDALAASIEGSLEQESRGVRGGEWMLDVRADGRAEVVRECLGDPRGLGSREAACCSCQTRRLKVDYLKSARKYEIC